MLIKSFNILLQFLGRKHEITTKILPFFLSLQVDNKGTDCVLIFKGSCKTIVRGVGGISWTSATRFWLSLLISISPSLLSFLLLVSPSSFLTLRIFFLSSHPPLSFVRLILFSSFSWPLNSENNSWSRCQYILYYSSSFVLHLFL